jgi:hypothetical protein
MSALLQIRRSVRRDERVPRSAGHLPWTRNHRIHAGPVALLIHAGRSSSIRLIARGILPGRTDSYFEPGYVLAADGSAAGIAPANNVTAECVCRRGAVRSCDRDREYSLAERYHRCHLPSSPHISLAIDGA